MRLGDGTKSKSVKKQKQLKKNKQTKKKTPIEKKNGTTKSPKHLVGLNAGSSVPPGKQPSPDLSLARSLTCSLARLVLVLISGGKKQNQWGRTLGAAAGPSFVPRRVLLPFSLKEAAAPAERHTDVRGPTRSNTCGTSAVDEQTQNPVPPSRRGNSTNLQFCFFHFLVAVVVQTEQTNGAAHTENTRHGEPEWSVGTHNSGKS